MKLYPVATPCSIGFIRQVTVISEKPSACPFYPAGSLNHYTFWPAGCISIKY